MTYIITAMMLLAASTVTMALVPFGIDHGDKHIPVVGENNEGFIEFLFGMDVNGVHYEKAELHASGYMDLTSLTHPSLPSSRIDVWKKKAPGNPTELYARLASEDEMSEIVATITNTNFSATFEADRMLIATWVNEDINGASDIPVSQFQCVVFSDGYESHVIFLNNDDCRHAGPVEEAVAYCTNPRSVMTNPLVKEPISSVATSYFQLRYDYYHTCLSLSSSRGYFVNCRDSYGYLSTSTRYSSTGSNWNVQIKLYGYSSRCLDREACHSSTSELRYSDCSHCGSLHWGYYWGELQEDDGNNCIYAYTSSQAKIHHSTGSCVEFSKYYSTMAFYHQEFPQPDISQFVDNVSAGNLKGLRLYRDSRSKTARFEIVHSLPTDMQFSVTADTGVYQAEYWVMDIQTSVPYKETLVPGAIIDWLKSSSEIVTSVGLQYGAVDIASQEFGEIDGVVSIFVTNNDGLASTEVQVNNESLLSNLVGVDSNEWWLTEPHSYSGDHVQTYYTFLEESPNYPGLYWTRESDE